MHTFAINVISCWKLVNARYSNDLPAAHGGSISLNSGTNPSLVRNGVHHYSTNVPVDQGETGTQPYIINSAIQPMHYVTGGHGNGSAIVMNSNGQPAGYQIVPSRTGSQVGYNENLTSM